MAQYIIAGDTEKYKGCLIYTCGSSIETAKKSLDRILNNPTKDDLFSIKGLTNIRILEEKEEDCWWLNGTN